MTYRRKEIIGNATLYLGDCREVLIDTPAYDAFISDPPWGLSRSSGTINKKRDKANYAGVSDTLNDVRKIFSPTVAAMIMACGRGAITPGTPHSFEYPKPDDIAAILQPGVQGMSKWGRPTWQPVLLYGKDPRAGLTIKPLTYTSNGKFESSDHPCPKPDDIMMWLVSRVTLHGETLIDPFMGSGTTGVAAMKQERKFIGIEIVPTYFDIACRRIEDCQRQGNLF